MAPFKLLLFVITCAKLGSASSVAAENADDIASASCGGLFEPIPYAEVPFYWPVDCDRCLLTAMNETQVKACNCTAGSPGYTDKGDARICNLSFPPAGLKPNLRARLIGTPAGTSYLKLLVEALDGRKLFLIGDSISLQLQKFLESRAKELGILEMFMGDHRCCNLEFGPNWYDHMKNVGNISKWEVWANSGRKTHLAAARHESNGVVYVYNSGLHVAACHGDPEKNAPCETTYRETVFLKQQFSIFPICKENTFSLH